MTFAQDITRHFQGDWTGSQGAFPAPGHSPKDRGITVKDAPDGDVIFYCHNESGFDWRAFKDHCRDLGLLPPRERPSGDAWRETGQYEYVATDGTVSYRTVRKEKAGERKRFVAQRPDGKGGWINGLGNVERILYRLPEIKEAISRAVLKDEPLPLIYLVEGERKADKLASWGFLATAIAFGAKGWRDSYAADLEGCTVAVLPDNDDEGRSFAERAAKSIAAAGGRPVIVELPDLPHKGDIIDWTGTADDLRALSLAALSAPPSNPVQLGVPIELPGGCDPSEWEGKRAPDRRFILDGWIVRGAAGLLGGQDGVGKSLIAQQLATCAAVGIDFLGLPIDRVKAIYITCEDPTEEMWRRQESINASLGIRMSDLKGWLKTYSLKGEIGNELATFDQSGRMTPTDRYQQVRRATLEFGASLVFIDNAAHVFAGNENARHDVAAFLGLLERLSIEIDGAVVLLAHPNKQHSQGNKLGNEYSGTTGWSAHVRNRLFIDWVADAEGAPTDPDQRVLRRSKANYAAKGEEIIFRWHRWAFTRDEDLPANLGAEIAANAQANADNQIFLSCLDERVRQQRAVSEKSGANYAPAIFAKMAESKHLGKARLAAAMDRLYRIGSIERGFLWRDTGEGRDVFGLRRRSANASANDPQTRVANAREQYPQPSENIHPISYDNKGAAIGAAAPCREEKKPVDFSRFERASEPVDFPADEEDPAADVYLNGGGR